MLFSRLREGAQHIVLCPPRNPGMCPRCEFGTLSTPLCQECIRHIVTNGMEYDEPEEEYLAACRECSTVNIWRSMNGDQCRRCHDRERLAERRRRNADRHARVQVEYATEIAAARLPGAQCSRCVPEGTGVLCAACVRHMMRAGGDWNDGDRLAQCSRCDSIQPWNGMSDDQCRPCHDERYG